MLYLNKQDIIRSITPQEMMEAITAVTPQRVQEAARTIALDTVYFLKGKEAEA